MYQLMKGDQVLYTKIKRANTFFSRLKGLMFSSSLNGCDALWITPCNQIHTFFMKYDLDVVFISKKHEVIKIVKNIKPYRLTWLYFKASSVLEFASGTLSDQIKEGDKLDLICTN